MPTGIPNAQGPTKKLEFLLKASIVAVIRNAGGNEEKKFYTTVFEINREAAKMPWYVLVNYLAPGHLTNLLGPMGQGWIKVYETKTIKLINRNNPNDITDIPFRVLTEDQLDIFIARWELPVRQKAFHDLSTARRFVALYQEDPKGYMIQYDQYVSGKNRTYPELDKFRKSYGVEQSSELTGEFDSADRKIVPPVMTPAPVPPVTMPPVLTPPINPLAPPELNPMVSPAPVPPVGGELIAPPTVPAETELPQVPGPHVMGMDPASPEPSQTVEHVMDGDGNIVNPQDTSGVPKVPATEEPKQPADQNPFGNV